jgi:hypothetical protein
MRKSEVYSWRISPEIRTGLELEARRAGCTMAGLLDRMAQGWLEARRRGAPRDDAEQARLHAAAARTLGTISGSHPGRAERARGAIRERLARRHDR